MAYDYVRRAYGVDPVPGERVRHHVTGRYGTIRKVRAEDQYVHVCFDGDKHEVRCHPTEMDYFGAGDCDGHVASAADPKVCGRCGIHIDDLRPDGDAVEP